MTYDKVKIDFSMMVLSILLALIRLSTKVVKNMEIIIRLINKMVLFSKNIKIEKKVVMKTHDKLIPKIEPSIKHKNYQSIVIMSINNKEYVEKVRQSTTESIQIVQLE